MYRCQEHKNIFPVLCLCHLEKINLKGIYFPGQKVPDFWYNIKRACLAVQIRGHTCTHICTYMQVTARGPTALQLILWDGVFQLELTTSARLTEQNVPGVLLSPPKGLQVCIALGMVDSKSDPPKYTESTEPSALHGLVLKVFLSAVDPFTQRTSRFQLPGNLGLSLSVINRRCGTQEP